MSDLDSQLEALHVANASKLNIEIWLEVPPVLIRGDKLGELATERENVLHLRASADIETKTLLHLLATSDILDPEVVGDVVWDLNDTIVVDTLEHAVHQANMLDD